ncbi:MAG: ABC transporter permease [Oscillospiraceae bacterium]|nr:ABC transporter permease [Clostridiaceae bacterium]MDY5890257.1 ABC transporter permease [Oscillospiraceae bacterium]MDY5935345.1 ABC transporter permease [Oscillospiraceae bacterium]
MDIRENIRIAIFSIKTNMMRSLLTMLGIIIGVASVIAIVTIGNGGRDYIVGMIEDMGSNAIQIAVNVNVANQSQYITEEDISSIKKLSNVTYCTPYEFTFGQVQANDYNGYSITIAGNEDMLIVNQLTPKYGRSWTRDEYEQKRNVCIMSTMTAKDIFGKENCVGETINYTVNNTTVSLKVIGVVDMANNSMISQEQMDSMMSMYSSSSQMTMAMIGIPASLNGELNDSVNKFTQVYLMAEDGSDLDNVGESALNLIKTRHGDFDDSVYTLNIMATYIDLLDSVINIFTTFIAAVSAISLLVGGIGVMNIMLVSVTERTREIGIRKALGAKTSTIMLQFLTESVILCLLGGAIGFILGVGGALSVAAYLKIPIAVKFTTVLIAVGFSSAIGIFFGIYPAKRAAQMTPIEALRRD